MGGLADIQLEDSFATRVTNADTHMATKMTATFLDQHLLRRHQRPLWAASSLAHRVTNVRLNSRMTDVRSVTETGGLSGLHSNPGSLRASSIQITADHVADKPGAFL